MSLGRLPVSAVLCLVLLASHLPLRGAQRMVEPFNGKDLSGWRALGGRWTVEEGVIVGRGEGPAGLATGDERWRDYRVDLEVQIEEGFEAGLIMRYGAESGYLVALLHQAAPPPRPAREGVIPLHERPASAPLSSGLILMRYLKPAPRASSPVEVAWRHVQGAHLRVKTKEWIPLTVEVRGREISVKSGAVGLLQVTDPTYSSGQLVLYRNAATAKFRNTRVTLLD